MQRAPAPRLLQTEDALTLIGDLRRLTAAQRNTFLASFLGWTFDSFDFFVLIFVLRPLADEFGTSVKELTFAIVLTLVARPVGALIFGQLADRYGRRPVLMINILCYSAIELASAFAPSLTVLLVLRALYGVAMGGMWGVAASLTFEVVPLSTRGLVSGTLQQGYAVGYLTADAVFAVFFSTIGWRGMFILGAIPVLLLPFIWFRVPESPVWRETARQKQDLFGAIVRNWRIVIFMIVLMTAFNFLSHGSRISIRHFWSRSIICRPRPSASSPSSTTSARSSAARASVPSRSGLDGAARSSWPPSWCCRSFRSGRFRAAYSGLPLGRSYFRSWCRVLGVSCRCI
jgi:MFS family permease